MTFTVQPDAGTIPQRSIVPSAPKLLESDRAFTIWADSGTVRQKFNVSVITSFTTFQIFTQQRTEKAIVESRDVRENQGVRRRRIQPTFFPCLLQDIGFWQSGPANKGHQIGIREQITWFGIRLSENTIPQRSYACLLTSLNGSRR